MKLDGYAENVAIDNSTEFVSDDDSLIAYFNQQKGPTADLASQIITSELVRQVRALGPDQISQMHQDVPKQILLEVGREIIPRSFNVKTMHIGIDFKLISETIASKLREKLGSLFESRTPALSEMRPVA